MARGGVELFRESRDREREPRVRVRESPARLRESSDLTATSVGDLEWRHDGGTLAGSGLHGRLRPSHARGGGGGVCDSRDREREPRVRVRESPARLRESSDLTATSVGDWEWTARPAGFNRSSHARGGGGL
jgi:hypothetical protein